MMGEKKKKEKNKRKNLETINNKSVKKKQKVFMGDNFLKFRFILSLVYICNKKYLPAFF